PDEVHQGACGGLQRTPLCDVEVENGERTSWKLLLDRIEVVALLASHGFPREKARRDLETRIVTDDAERVLLAGHASHDRENRLRLGQIERFEVFRLGLFCEFPERQLGRLDGPLGGR